MAKTIKLSEKNPSELTSLLAEKREELRTVRFAAAGARAKDAATPRKIRADIARILTELGSRAAA